MNLVELQRKLIAAARAKPPGDGVPYAFEKRIMARLAGEPAPNPWHFWELGFSRAAVCCAVTALMLAIGAHFLPASNPEPLSQDVEKTLFAAVDNTGADLAGDNR